MAVRIIARRCRGCSVVAARICKDRARALTDWGAGNTLELNGAIGRSVHQRSATLSVKGATAERWRCRGGPDGNGRRDINQRCSVLLLEYKSSQLRILTQIFPIPTRHDTGRLTLGLLSH